MKTKKTGKTKPYKVLTEPLSAEDLKGDPWIEVVVAVHLRDIIDADYEQFLDMLSEEAIGTELLEDIIYDLVGHDGDILHLRVTGNAHSLLEEIE